VSPAQPGRPDRPDRPELVYTVSGAARRLGMPAATLRTWERRHGIGPSGRSPGGHRRYSAADLSRLRAMRTLVGTGIPPAQAAVLAALAAPASHEQALAASAGAALPTPGAGPGPGSEPGSEPGGEVPAALAVRAADALDTPLLVATLGDAFARLGVCAAWERLAVPALREIGARPAPAAGHGAAEHMLSGCLMAVLLGIITAAPAARAPRPVLLGCAPEEQHVLPVYALHAELAGRRVDVRPLGSRVPRPALVHAVGAVRPAAVFLWSQMAVTADPELLRGLPPGPRLVAGGRGWAQSALPAGVALAATLEGAAGLLSESAWGPA
jgi:MerR family transcriptional regulator, light-induced transcriptional regulator